MAKAKPDTKLDKKKPGKKRGMGKFKQGPPQKKFLFAGAGALLVGLGLLAYQAVTSDPDDESEPRAGLQQPAGTTGESGVSGSATAAVRDADDETPWLKRLRPIGFLDTFSVDGKAPEVVPVSALKPKPNGEPQTVYCLLHAQLDAATERAWSDAGLLQGETQTFNPFLRKVTFSNQETLDNLVDWHVEGVFLKDPTL